MRDARFYQPISEETLTDEKFEALSTAGKLVWLSMLLLRRNFPAALIVSRESLMVALPRMPTRDAKRGIREVLAAGMVEVGWPTHPVVFFPNWAKHDPQVLKGAISWRTARGWIPVLQRLPKRSTVSRHTAESILRTLRAHMPTETDAKNREFFAQTVEMIEKVVEGASHGASDGASHGAPQATNTNTTTRYARSSISAAAPPPGAAVKPVVVVGKKGKPNSSKTTTTPNGHSARNVGGVDHFAGERERRFLEFWGTFRSERGMSPESLTEDQLPALMELLDQAEHQWPHDSDLALSYLVTDFLRDTTLNRPTLTTLLKPSVWPARLDAACSRARDHAERAVERARKRNRGL